MTNLTRPDASATCDPLHLADQITAAIGKPVTCDIDGATVIVYEDLTSAETNQAQAVVDAYTYDSDYIPPSPAKDWRDKLRAEVAFIDSQIATWPTDATNNTQALQRVNFLLAATQRIARNQARILQFIDNATMDSGA